MPCRALFEAMQKKETYATTGTRIIVRFFGGWNYEENDVFSPNAAAIGYAGGVPMGGDLPARPSEASAPRFMVGLSHQGLNISVGANVMSSTVW